MKQFFETLVLNTEKKSLIEITKYIHNFLNNSKISNGLLNLSILHTSASLIIQENADSDVKTDLIYFFDSIVKQDKNFLHTTEGIDDMPAHIKTVLTQTNLTISIIENELKLGTWQGVYLFEHRLDPKSRKILMHVIGN